MNNFIAANPKTAGIYQLILGQGHHNFKTETKGGSPGTKHYTLNTKQK